jgi:dTDP-4-dehydrorhamnose 3,5-epimerase
MVQANLSVSRAGVLRGLHFHLRQTDYWVLLEGTAFVGLVDLRRGSASRDRSEHLRLDGALGPRGLLIPPGVAHGFYAETPIRLGYLVDLAFDGSDERGIAWDDPDAAIPWPARDPILSERDRANPSLAQVLATAAAPEPSPPEATHLG